VPSESPGWLASQPGSRALTRNTTRSTGVWFKLPENSCCPPVTGIHDGQLEAPAWQLAKRSHYRPAVNAGAEQCSHDSLGWASSPCVRRNGYRKRRAAVTHYAPVDQLDRGDWCDRGVSWVMMQSVTAFL
jgi:hypothetical protein